MMEKKWSDDRIMSEYRDGHREKAFEALMEAYRERLYWHIRRFVCSHEDTDDLLQETFVKVWSSLPGFRGDSSLLTWVYRIATNEALNFLRRQKVRGMLHAESLDTILNKKIDTDPWFNGNELQRELHKAMARLPKMQKTVFSLRYFDDLSYKEISDITGVSVGSLKASYHHAYTKIRQELEKKF